MIDPYIGVSLGLLDPYKSTVITGCLFTFCFPYVVPSFREMWGSVCFRSCMNCDAEQDLDIGDVA